MVLRLAGDHRGYETSLVEITKSISNMNMELRRNLQDSHKKQTDGRRMKLVNKTQLHISSVATMSKVLHFCFTNPTIQVSGYKLSLTVPNVLTTYTPIWLIYNQLVQNIIVSSVRELKMIQYGATSGELGNVS
ncbi:hypothetical protein LXL04_023690 [Taraxacum kok-saghyz]